MKQRAQMLEAELQRILGIIREKVRPEKVVLFGSLASGKQRPESDIDLLIIQNSNENMFNRVRRIEELLNRKYAADLIVLTPREVKILLDSNNRYLHGILANGKVLYERAA